MTARLYLDEDVSPDAAVRMREQGTDAMSCHEIGALGIDDEEQLRIATSRGRAIVTCNYRDFLQLAQDWSLAGTGHTGIIVSYRQYSRNEIEQLVRAIEGLAKEVPAKHLVNATFVLDVFTRESPV